MSLQPAPELPVSWDVWYSRVWSGAAGRWVGKACADPRVKLRLFGKPDARKYRRMGVVAAYGESVEEARKLANDAAASVTVKFGE